MNCNSKQSGNQSCGCQKNVLSNPELWSKKKKINYLENSLKCLQEHIAEIEESIKELKG